MERCDKASYTCPLIQRSRRQKAIKIMVEV